MEQRNSAALQSPFEYSTDPHLLEQLIARSPFAMALINGPEHRFGLVNPAFIGLAAGQAVRDQPYREVFPDFAATHIPQIEQVYQQLRTVTIMQQPIGEDVAYQTHAWQFTFAPLRDKEAAPTGVLCYVATLPRHADERAAQHEQDEREAFLQVASHELWTPLTTLKGLTQMAYRRLGAGGDPLKARSNLTMANQQIVRMEALINKLLDVPRLRNGELPLLIERCDLADLVRAAVLRTQAMTEQHTLRLRGDEAQLPLDADALRIEQVLNNLLLNAVKFTPHGGAISVTLSTQDDWATVRVADSGIGIPLDDRAHLFERFYRCANAPARHFSGLGIGLYLSMEIVKRHNGQLWLETTGAAGSVFALALPLTCQR
jgi:signal transduction histidine kinase